MLGTAFWVTCEPGQVRERSALELLGLALCFITPNMPRKC